MSNERISAIKEHAAAFVVDGLQTLYGHVHTTKVHRLIQHVANELRGRNNLWEGDTSDNEKLHSGCTRMFRRTNQRGPTVALQMMRCDVCSPGTGASAWDGTLQRPPTPIPP